MHYIKVIDQDTTVFPYSVWQLRVDNPNVCFPKDISDSTLAEWGVYPVVVVDKPEVDFYHVAELLQQPSLIEGVWVLGWGTRDKNQDEIDEEAANARAIRNAKLAECDWTQLKDSPLSPEVSLLWADYRQALRDVTSQDLFPFVIAWPVAP